MTSMQRLTQLRAGDVAIELCDGLLEELARQSFKRLANIRDKSSDRASKEPRLNLIVDILKRLASFVHQLRDRVGLYLTFSSCQLPCVLKVILRSRLGSVAKIEASSPVPRFATVLEVRGLRGSFLDELGSDSIEFLAKLSVVFKVRAVLSQCAVLLGPKDLKPVRRACGGFGDAAAITCQFERFIRALPKLGGLLQSDPTLRQDVGIDVSDYATHL